MPPKRAKAAKHDHEGAVETAKSDSASTALAQTVEERVTDQAHNLQQLCRSVLVLSTAVTSWPWHCTSKAAVRAFLSAQQQVSFGCSKLQDAFNNIQCNTCAAELEAALADALTCKELSITKHVSLTISADAASLTLKGITADTLSLLVRMVETAAGGDKSGCNKTPAELIAAAQQAAVVDGAGLGKELLYDIGDIPAEELALCAERPDAVLQPDESSEPRIDQNLLLMLENLTQRKERATELCRAVDTAVSVESEVASTAASGIDWNPKFAHLLQSADHALGAWLRQLTMQLIAVGSLQSMVFLTGSSDSTAAAAALADVLWNYYDSCLRELMAIVLGSREQQLKLAPQPSTMALFLQQGSRQAIAKALELKFAEISKLHDNVLHFLSFPSTQQLLQQVEQLRSKWEPPLLTEHCGDLDEFAKKVLLTRLQLFSGENGITLAGQTDLLAMELQHDAQLIRAVTEWEAMLDTFKEQMLKRASKDLSPAQYPQTSAYTQVLKDWHAEYEAEWDDAEQQKHFQSHAYQNEMTGINNQFTSVKQQLKVVEAQLAKEQQQLAKQQLQQQQRSSASATGAVPAATAPAAADSESAASASAAADSSTAGSTDSNSEQSASISALEARKQELTAQKQLAQHTQVGAKLLCRNFMVSSLMRRYWRTREFCARLRAHTAVKARRADKLCGGNAAAESRLRVIVACCTLNAVSLAMSAWVAEQTEQQLLLEAGTVSAGPKQQQQQRKGKKGKGEKASGVTATSETILSETAESETTVAAGASAGDANASSSSSDAAVEQTSITAAAAQTLQWHTAVQHQLYSSSNQQIAQLQ
jgi:hypothetical protein